VLSIHLHGETEENRENFFRIVDVDSNRAALLLQTSRSVNRGSTGRRSWDFSFSRWVQAGSKDHPTSCPEGTAVMACSGPLACIYIVTSSRSSPRAKIFNRDSHVTWASEIQGDRELCYLSSVLRSNVNWTRSTAHTIEWKVRKNWSYMATSTFLCVIPVVVLNSLSAGQLHSL
jgi:hypothetical protein